MALVKPRDKGVCLNLYLYFNVNWVVCTTFRRRFSYDRRHCSLAEIIRAADARINPSCTKSAQVGVMSIYLRPKVPGASVFFTVNLMTRGSRLLVDEIDRLREAVQATRAERPFQIDAWVVLPDHLHAVWTLPPGDADFSTRWGAIKARFTKSLNREHRRPGFSPAPAHNDLPVVMSGRYAGLKPGLRVNKREAAVWQRRFWEHHIRNRADFDAHVRYCWNNPVNHGLVEHPTDWPFSSIHRDIRAGRVDPEWSGDVLEEMFKEPNS